MTAMLRRRTLPLGVAGALLLAAASGCADKEDGEAGAPASESSESSESSAPATDEITNDELAQGLLPAEAFGPDADVVTVDLRQLSTSGATLPEGASVTPAECSDGLGAIELGPDDFGAVVAQTAQTPTTLTVNVLAEDDTIEADSAAGFDELLQRCSHVDLTAPDGSSGSIDFRSFEVPEVGDVSEGVGFTMTIAGPDGSASTVNCLLGIGVEGHRMVYLQQVGADGAPLDEAAFSDLFGQAYEAQEDI